MTSLQQAVSSSFPQWPWQFDYLLGPSTYFKIGGPAEVYLELAEVAAVAQLTKWCTESAVPLKILGGASNVIVADQGVSGIVLHLTNDTFQVVTAGNPGVVQVGAGSKTALVVSQTVKAGYAGLEYFLGVPGTLGGAIFNNAHYLQHMIGEYVNRVHVATPTGELVWLNQNECDFGYDHSRFQTSGEVIVMVEFTLPAGNAEQSRELIAHSTRYRASTQPLGEPSSGCIFQNTPNTPDLQARFPQFASQPFVPGGFLIDQAGLKGYRIGGVEVSHKHAAFIVNKDHGTAADVKALIAHVKATVMAQFGVQLEEEVFYVE